MDLQPWISVDLLGSFTKRRAGELLEGQPWSVAKLTKVQVAEKGHLALERRPESRADLRDNIAKKRRGEDQDVRRACPQTLLRGVKTLRPLANIGIAWHGKTRHHEHVSDGRGGHSRAAQRKWTLPGALFWAPWGLSKNIF